MVLQNNVSKLWNIRGNIVSRRSHQGLPTDSYIVKSHSTGQHICQSEWNICAIKANVSPTGSDIDPDHVAATVFSVSGIVSRPSLKSSSHRTQAAKLGWLDLQASTLTGSGLGSAPGSVEGN